MCKDTLKVGADQIQVEFRSKFSPACCRPTQYVLYYGTYLLGIGGGWKKSPPIDLNRAIFLSVGHSQSTIINESTRTYEALVCIGMYRTRDLPIPSTMQNGEVFHTTQTTYGIFDYYTGRGAALRWTRALHLCPDLHWHQGSTCVWCEVELWCLGNHL